MPKKVTLKKCLHCHELKDPTLFEPRRNVCKACRCTQCKASRAKLIKKNKSSAWAPPKTHTCSTCKKTHKASFFGKNAEAPTGLKYVCNHCLSIYSSEYKMKKYNTDPHYRLDINTGSMFYKALAGNKVNKSTKKKLKLLGYTLQELRDHLEDLFDEVMSWDSYGQGWHLDHSVSKTKFKCAVGASEKDILKQWKKCWALSNLQPMWAIENISKGARYDGPYVPDFIGE